MCIIAVKPAGEEWPTWKTLQQCWDRNPDGAGYMYNNHQGKVVIEKGFMTWASFRKAIKMLKRRCSSETTVVMHFRIKTHGAVSPECCHPFPLSSELNDLRSLSFECDYGIAHNGIISGRDTSTLKSDTMDFVMNFVYPISKMTENWTDNAFANQLIEHELDACRLFILDGTGYFWSFGNWYEDNGMWYSNESYKKPKVVVNTYYPVYSTGYDYNKWSTNKIADKKEKKVEELGFGAFDDDEVMFLDEANAIDAADKDWWNEATADDVKRLFDEMPSDACTNCPEYAMCVQNGYWNCVNDDDALDYISVLWQITELANGGALRLPEKAEQVEGEKKANVS